MLQKYRSEEVELEAAMGGEDSQADLDDCRANISGLTEELQGLKREDTYFG